MNDLRPVRIGGRLIGPGRPCYVIAEAGVNHNGDVKAAHRLVVAAKQAGADCVKFQTFRAERVATAAAPKARYQMATTDPAESQIAMLRALELPIEAFAELSARCRDEGIDFLSTPYSLEDVDVLEQVGVEAFKVPSALLVEPRLLARMGATGKPILLSTGLATMAEVEEAVDVLRRAGNPPLVLLQCTTDYPAALEDANLRAMVTMRQRFGVVTGYSDHTRSSVACLGAVALGAAVVEKHFTLDRAQPGPDHASSADPAEFRALVSAIRELESALGSGEKRPSAREQANAVGMRRSLVARVPIAAGAVITEADLACKRPATGIAPRDIDRVVGRVAKVRIDADTILDWGMLG